MFRLIRPAELMTNRGREEAGRQGRRQGEERLEGDYKVGGEEMKRLRSSLAGQQSTELSEPGSEFGFAGLLLAVVFPRRGFMLTTAAPAAAAAAVS